jgi:CheY-like chemotaxis protein
MLCPVPAGQTPFRARRKGKGGQRVVVIHSDPEVRKVLLETVSATGVRATALESFPVGGLVGDSISHILVEEGQLERFSPSWPPRVSVILLYPRSATYRAVIPGRGRAEVASPFLPSEVRHVLRGGTFAHGAPVSGSGAGKSTGHGLGLHVLLVDDSRTNLKIAEQVLGRMGCAVTTATNGSEALLALAKAEVAGEAYDVVLMDCQMPVLDGYEATRRIRQSSAPYHSIPVIALTAQIGPDERTHCLDAGMNDYLTKPISRQSLWRILQRHAARSGPRQTVEISDRCTELRQPVREMEQWIGTAPS